VSEAFRKIRRVQPLIKMRRFKVEEEATVLARIRTEKQRTMQEMLENQRRYMQGVEEMNKLRATKMRENLQTLESTLDFVKSQWYRLYKQVQEIEIKEKMQVGQLLTAERDLKAIQKLEENYQVEFQKELNRTEQRATDESSLRKFVTR